MSPRAGLDRNKLLQTAGQMADEYGLEQVTLAKLAQALGIRSPSLYNHVHGLQDLRHHLAVHALRILQDTLTRAAVGRSGEEAVHAMGRAYVSFSRDHPGLYEAALQAPGPDHIEHQKLSDEMVQLLLQVLESFGIEGEEAIHAVRGLRCLFHGFATLEQKGGFGLPVNTDETFSYMIRTFLSGLRQS